MARGMVECTCERCGNTFTKIKHGCMNRADATRWEEWAKENCTLCPDCWAKDKKAADEQRVAALIKEFNLPDITGVSEKQIKYATDLRNDALKNSERNIRKIRNCIEAAEKGEFDDYARENNTTPDQMIRDVLEQYQWPLGWYTMFSTGSARQIIDDMHHIVSIPRKRP